MEAKKPTKAKKEAVKEEKPTKVPAEKLAVLTIGGTQHLVTEGALLTVPSLEIAEGKTGKSEALILIPEIGKGSVTYKVLEHKKGPKVVTAKYKAKSRYRRKVGFRASLSEIEIEKIEEGK